MTAPDELKPCPFCGGEGEIISLFPNAPHPGNTFIKCKSCLCTTWRGNIHWAIAAWNMRIEPKTPVPQIVPQNPLTP